MTSLAIDTTPIGEDAPPERLVSWLLERFAGRRIVLTTAFGMEGCALIDMLARGGQAIPVIWLDTGFLFPETHRLRERLQARYPHLRFVRYATSVSPEEQETHFGPELWRRDPDACCRLRKVDPMREALAGVDVWITGISRSQSAARVWEYVQAHDVPYNELHQRGYPTLGCTHCTVPVVGVKIGGYSREGRWAGNRKSECGLHLSPK